MRRRFERLVLSLCTLGSLQIGFVQEAAAWGALGHATVGVMANAYLTPKAREQVKTILKGKPLHEVCSWADAVKNLPEWQHTHKYHFVSLPDGKGYIEGLRGMKPQTFAQGDVIRAILKAEEILSSSTVSNQERANALSLLAHFVADLHQPFHTGRESDRGGTRIPINWFGEKSNLHFVWDTGILESAHKPLFRAQPPNTPKALTYAKELLKNTTIEPVRNGGSVELWLRDSLQARAKAYQVPLNDPAQIIRDSSGTIDRLLVLSAQRLASRLNDILDPTTRDWFARSEDGRLKQQLQQIFGKVEGFEVSLSPLPVSSPAGTRMSSPITAPQLPTTSREWNGRDRHQDELRP